ncbi:MAG: dihydroorotate dehydrogenase [Candidatus Omnitrophica bacterium]|nr:dihydroorotate dehydrogenase [Candidatus Omnitrophota bacterium]
MGVKESTLSVGIGKLKLKSPVIAASGTFGYGEEYRELVSLSSIGGIVTKSISLKAYEGNKPPRIWETTAGMLNSIGLQNEGVGAFIESKLSDLKRLPTAVIVSIAGDQKDEFRELAKRLDKTSIDAIEINISCPNIKHKSKSRLFSQDPDATAEIVRAVRRNTKKPLITKLSPNVTDITEIAKAAERAGTDAISLINTVIGMAVDIDTKRPRLGNVTGGLSGPCIKPIALRMVWEVYNAVKVPVIGMGGIMNTEDAIEFFLCGASAIQVGTANFINPRATTEVVAGLREYLKKNKLTSIKDLIGKLKI